MLKKLISKITMRIITLRYSILSIFITIFVITTFLLVTVTSYRFEKTLTITSFELMDKVSSQVLEQINGIMTTFEVESQFIANLLAQGVLNKDSEQMIHYMKNTVIKIPLVQRMLLGNIDGDFISANEQLDKNILMDIIQREINSVTGTQLLFDTSGKLIFKKKLIDVAYDPRKRPWYALVAETHKTRWTNFYLYQPDNTLHITVSSPIHSHPEGKFIGVIGLDTRQDYLQHFIDKIKISEHGLLFIVNRNGSLIAYSELAKLIKAKNTKLLNIQDAGLEWLSQSLAEYNQNKKSNFTIHYEGNTYLFTYKELPKLGQYGWLLGVMIPRSDYTHNLERLHLATIVISLLAFTLGILAILRLVNRIIKPINLLVTETEKIKRLELNDKINISSRIKEVIALVNAMSGMKLGLRSFQKYVPNTLVKKLIETQEDTRIGGIKIPIAVLFTDIKDFTTKAEITDPNLLMIQLGEYFEELSNIIMDYQGTIDKYIGDSIMAFWGAPIADEQAATHATQAALACSERLKKLNSIWSAKGYTPFVTRMGVHIGDAIVGNVGSSERLNYTAIGDTINFASRLEEINKNYGTHIIISETIYQQIKDSFVTRFIDYVAVKGKTQSGKIYELLAEDMQQIHFDIKQYNIVFSQGFAAYVLKDWENAIQLFEQCIQIYPEDSVAPIFISRCLYFKNTPPPVDWNGVWRIRSVN